VVGQQVTVRAARTLLGRIVAAWGEPSADAVDARCAWHFPTAPRIAGLAPRAVARIGLTPTRARALVALAQAIAAGDLVLEPGGDVVATVGQLESIPGIGPWTAQLVAMRALGWPDAFPAGDRGVLAALGEKRPDRALARGEAWRPWRAYAVMHLWRARR
jgi:AraC family transcriptional regulator of adaptative response / DNA-3-methyladenine glycosylase II